MAKKKRTFEEFLLTIYGISLADYNAMPAAQQKALELDYINRYGSPIVWW